MFNDLLRFHLFNYNHNSVQLISLIKETCSEEKGFFFVCSEILEKKLINATF